jgi:hypothetical protein
MADGRQRGEQQAGAVSSAMEKAGDDVMLMMQPC